MSKPPSAETIFFAALTKGDPASRVAYLDEACRGDAELRRRVERLLAAHPGVGSFMEKPLADRAAGAEALGETAAHPSGANADDDSADLAGILTPSEKPGHLGRLDHYEIVEVVGRGGMGVVLKGFDGKLHRVVAIKVMARDLAASAAARQRFTREARAAAAVSHDHVVTIHAVEEDRRPPYLVMQFVEGVSLQEKLDRGGPLPLKEVLRIGMQTAEGLAAAHRQGLVHRDIKPANILLENGVERVKITDFGLARAVDDASLTHSGVIAGTPLYMSPEQASGAGVDHRSDLFSLGSMLYAMCTGRPPFRATEAHVVMRRVIEDTPRPIAEVNPDVPGWLCDVVARLHAKDPAGRFQSAAEVADLLGQHLAHVQQPGTAQRRPVPRARRPVVPARWRSRPWAFAVGVLVLLVLGGGALLAYQAGWLSPSPHLDARQARGRGDDAVAELRRTVAAREEDLRVVRINFEAELVSRLELCTAEALVLEARIKLAAAEQAPVVPLLQELVRRREEELALIQVRVDLGADPPTRASSAKQRLSEARARLAAAQSMSHGAASIGAPVLAVEDMIRPSAGQKDTRKGNCPHARAGLSEVLT